MGDRGNMQEKKQDPEKLKERTKQYALRVVRVAESLPRNRVAQIIVDQLVRSGTSVGANYRAACRAKSRADFISKMGTVEEEADESLYWMEILIGAGLMHNEQLAALMQEGEELLSIVVSSIITARKNR